MKILQAHKYYYHRDGASNYVLQLSDLLEDHGHTVIPFAMKNSNNLKSPYSRFFVSEMKLNNPSKLSLTKKLKYASRMIYSTEAKQKIKKLIDKTNVDIVHLHNIYHHISPSILPSIKKRGIPVVMTLHDYKLICPNYTMFHHGKNHEEDCNGFYGSCVSGKCMKDSRTFSRVVQLEMIFHHKIMRYYRRYVDKFIAPSEFMMNMCIRHGWDKKDFINIKNPVDTRQFSPTKKDGQFVTYIGRLSEEKGLQTLLDSAKLTPHIPYQIIGQGPLESKIKERIKKEEIDNIDLLGFKNGKDLQASYNDARILVLPSLWYENYPLSILEAKAKAKIIIASNIGGIKEMLPKDFLTPSGNSGSLAKTVETWYKKSYKERQKIGKGLRKEVQEQNSITSHHEQIISLYREVIEHAKI